MWCFLLSHSQEAEGGGKWDWVWPSFFFSGRDYCGIQPWRCTASPTHTHPPTAGCDDIKPCFCLSLNLLFFWLHSLVPSPSWLPSGGGAALRTCGETWLDFRGRDYLGQSHLALVFLHTKRGQHDFLCFREKKLSSIFRFLFFSSIFRYLESVLHPHSYCSSLVFFHVLSQSTYVLFFLQEADCTNVHSKLLVCSSDVYWSNVHDGQPGCLLSFVLNHSLGPLTCVLL